MAIDASVLSLFPSTSSSTSDALLNIIYGTGGAASGGDPIQALQLAETNQTKDVALQASQPDVARDIAAFRTAVAAAKTPADLLANPQALKVLLTANGLGDQASYTALATKALLSDTTQTTALANTLTDTRWKTLAQTFDFANKGLSVIQSQTTLDSIATGYAQVQWETSLDQTTPGLSSALDFRARASTITSVDQVLGDKTFRAVISGAFNIPQEIAFQSLSTQEADVASKIDLTKFSDPKYVDQLTKQFLINTSGASSTSSSQSGGLLSLFT